MSVPLTGYYNITGLGRTVTPGTMFTRPEGPPPDNLWPIEALPSTTFGLPYYQLTPLPNGNYHIRLASSPVWGLAERLWAKQDDTVLLNQWAVISVPQHGTNAYLINGPIDNAPGYWNVPEGPEKQITLKDTLSITPGHHGAEIYEDNVVFFIDKLF